MTGAYLYQTIHTLDGRPVRLERHMQVLDAASQVLFGRAFHPDITTLAQRITALATAEHTDRSVFVRLSLLPSGEWQAAVAGRSLYRGYALRSLCPEAVSLCYDTPFGDYPSSAREAATALALTQAALQHAHCVVHCNTAGHVLTCDDAPLFAVRGRQVFTSPARSSVEHAIGSECIAAAGLELIEAPVAREELPRFEELFAFDHRGVTAIARCDGHPYMSLKAERIAAASERLILNL